MQTRPEHGEPEGFPRLERVILGLLVGKYCHPWTIDEIEREIGGESSNVSPAIHRLDEAGLLHSWDEFVCPTHASMHTHEIMESEDADSEFEHGWERRVFVLLLASTDGLPELEVLRELAAQDNAAQLAVTDALNRLDGAGLVDRKNGRATASQAGVRFDRTMTL
jgi:DNA-binding MarR family transcriptional regulator